MNEQKLGDSNTAPKGLKLSTVVDFGEAKINDGIIYEYKSGRRTQQVYRRGLANSLTSSGKIYDAQGGLVTTGDKAKDKGLFGEAVPKCLNDRLLSRVSEMGHITTSERANAHPRIRSNGTTGSVSIKSVNKNNPS